MQLTRRDALAALTAIGVGGIGFGVGGDLSLRVGEESDGVTQYSLSSDHLDTIVAVAEVVYPSEISIQQEFIETYVDGRTKGRQQYREGMQRAIRELNRLSADAYGLQFRQLSPDRRDQLLRSAGVDRVTPARDGTLREQIRYYLVNDLLYALYTTPTGGSLIGNTNPPGHPGGIETYQTDPTDQ